MLGGLRTISGSLGLNPDEEAILAMKHATSKGLLSRNFTQITILRRISWLMIHLAQMKG